MRPVISIFDRDDLRRRVERHAARLFGYALSLTNDRDDAADLLHDGIVKALSARSTPSDERALRAWLFRILRNTFIDQQRRRAREGAESIPAYGEAVESGEDAPLQWTWNHDDALISALTVRLALRRLSVRHREVIALVDIAGFTYEEAAKILEIPRGTVMSRLSRARMALLAVIGETNVHPLPLPRGQSRR